MTCTRGDEALIDGLVNKRQQRIVVPIDIQKTHLHNIQTTILKIINQIMCKVSDYIPLSTVHAHTKNRNASPDWPPRKSKKKQELAREKKNTTMIKKEGDSLLLTNKSTLING